MAEKFRAVFHYPVVNWYPGHMAKASRNAMKKIENCDVFIEVRDARVVTI
jgi:ribosome biogenesis GTPase A